MGSLPPGSMGPPLIGQTLTFIRDPYAFLEERRRRYGDVFRSGIFGRRVVFLAGTKGAEAFYDDDRISRVDAHPFPLVTLFGGENMEMLDGARHHALKIIALKAFGPEAIDAYLPAMESLIEAMLERWAHGEVLATIELKRLAIEAIWTNLMGSLDGPEAQTITSDYEQVLRGLTSAPVAIPGAPYARARAARDRLLASIGRAIDERRAKPTADGLSTMLTATVDGVGMTNREAALEVHHVVIAGFIVYLLMTEVLRQLAEQPDLLARCDAEIAMQVPAATPLTGRVLGTLRTCTEVVMETKRFVPIVPVAFGRARRTFALEGYEVPEGWTVYLALHLNSHDPRVFRDPDRFDPDRFGTKRAEHHAHPMAFIPQGAEPPTGHRCLGVQYSTALVLAFMVVLLRGHRWELPPQDLRLDRRRVPPEPRDGLRVRLRARA